MSEQYPQQHQQQPGSMLEIRPSFLPLAFLLYFCKPYYSINGSPAAAGRWKQNTVPLPPGRYQVTVWVKYLFRPQMGLSSIAVDVPPGAAVVVTWRAPLTIFGSGRIQVAGIGPVPGVQAQPAANAPVGASSGAPAPAAPASPPAPQPRPAPSAAAGWHPDPTGRHQVRYFEGSRWTEHVSDGGTQGRDPIA